MLFHVFLAATQKNQSIIPIKHNLCKSLIFNQLRNLLAATFGFVAIGDDV